MRSLRTRLRQTFRFSSDNDSEYADEVLYCSKIWQNNVCMQKPSIVFFLDESFRFVVVQQNVVFQRNVFAWLVVLQNDVLLRKRLFRVALQFKFLLLDVLLRSVVVANDLHVSWSNEFLLLVSSWCLHLWRLDWKSSSDLRWRVLW